MNPSITGRRLKPGRVRTAQPAGPGGPRVHFILAGQQAVVRLGCLCGPVRADLRACRHAHRIGRPPPRVPGWQPRFADHRLGRDRLIVACHPAGRR